MSRIARIIALHMITANGCKPNSYPDAQIMAASMIDVETAREPPVAVRD
jgi:hypothetical protein